MSDLVEKPEGRFSHNEAHIILFRSVSQSIVTHTGIYKQRNGTEQEFLYIKILHSTEK